MSSEDIFKSGRLRILAMLPHIKASLIPMIRWMRGNVRITICIFAVMGFCWLWAKEKLTDDIVLSTPGMPVMKRVQSFSTGSVTIATAWSSDEQEIATADGPLGNIIKVWDREGKKLGEPHVVESHTSHDMEFISENKKILAVSSPAYEGNSYTAFDVWSVDTSDLDKKIPGLYSGLYPDYPKQNGRNTSGIFAVSQDKTMAVMAISQDYLAVFSIDPWRITQVIKLNEQKLGRMPETKNLEGIVQSIAISPDKKTIALGFLQNQIAILQLDHAQEVPQIIDIYPGNNSSIVLGTISFSPNGLFIAAAIQDLFMPLDASTEWLDKHPTVTVWSSYDHHLVAGYQHVSCCPGQGVWQLSWSADSKYLSAVAQDNSISIFKPLAPNERIHTRLYHDLIMSARFAPHSNLLAAGIGDHLTIFSLQE